MIAIPVPLQALGFGGATASYHPLRPNSDFGGDVHHLEGESAKWRPLCSQASLNVTQDKERKTERL